MPLTPIPEHLKGLYDDQIDHLTATLNELEAERNRTLDALARAQDHLAELDVRIESVSTRLDLVTKARADEFAN